jgi:hypothetical protein
MATDNHRMRTLRLPIVAFVALVLFATASAAEAHATRSTASLPHIRRLGLPLRADPIAPPGAVSYWLPPIQWVMERWLPFNADSLYRDLGLANAADESFLYFYLNTGKNIGDLARTFGMNVPALAKSLLHQRQSRYPPRLYETLLRRTQEMLTQPHLAQHVLFHWFHDWANEFDTVPLYGVPAATVYRLRHVDNESLAQIAASRGISRNELRHRLLAREWSATEVGVSLGALSRAQAVQRQQQLEQYVNEYIDVRPRMKM